MEQQQPKRSRQEFRYDSPVRERQQQQQQGGGDVAAAAGAASATNTVVSSPVELMMKARQALTNFRVELEKFKDKPELLMPALNAADSETTNKLLENLDWMEQFVQERRNKLLAKQNKRKLEESCNNNNSNNNGNVEETTVAAVANGVAVIPQIED